MIRDYEMKPAQRAELQNISRESSVLMTLLELYERMPIGWAHYAIVTLAKQNVDLFKKVVDAEMTLSAAPLLKPLDGDKS